MTENYFVVEIYSDETVNVSVMSRAEVEAVKDDMDEWQYAPASEVEQEEMIERAEEHGFEHDPW